METTLRKLMKHISRVFGRRDRLYFPNAVDRTNLLLFAVDDVQDGLRKGATKEELAHALAQVVARMFCCVEVYHKLPFIEMLAAKYPFGVCSFCNQQPCQCDERRDGITLRALNAEQLDWSLGDWCASLGATYGEKNKERGVEYTLLRLFGEVRELLSLQMSTAEYHNSIDDLEKDITFELADILGWAVAVANVLEINLEKAVLNRYGKGCDVCKRKVCRCTSLSTHRATWLSQQTTDNTKT